MHSARKAASPQETSQARAWLERLADRRTPGRYRLACPVCATQKARPRDDALVLDVEPDGGAVAFCHRCNWRAGRAARRGLDRIDRALEPLPAPARRADRGELALRLWREAAGETPELEDIHETPAGMYLLERGIEPRRLPPHTGLVWPAALRWHRARSALVIAINELSGIYVRAAHLVLLDARGRPRTRDNGKKLKLTYGSVKNRAVTFGFWPDDRGRWAIAEGAETALAAAMLLGIPTWASLGATNLRHVRPPSWARSVAIVADHDEAGLEAAALAARAWISSGISVTVLSTDKLGCDAADIVRETRNA